LAQYHIYSKPTIQYYKHHHIKQQMLGVENFHNF